MKKMGLCSWIIGMLGVIGLNVLAWTSTEFCDRYTMSVFPILSSWYGRITSRITFSIGEIMLILAVLLTVSGVGIFLSSMFLKKMKGFALGFWKAYAWIFLVVCYVMTCNCFILYHNTNFHNKYLVRQDAGDMMANMAGGIAVGTEENENIYTKKNLEILRDYLVEQCNEYAMKMPRDESGVIVYDKDIIEEAMNALREIGQNYDQLQGELVTPKYFSASEFFSQQRILGYYFPFSMEANLNSLMYMTNVAPTVCHELAHTKGFMNEDDCNMIAFIACTESEDEFIQYCGYLSVLNYVNNQFYESINKDMKTYKKHIRISDQVADDNMFLTRESWEKVEKKAIIKTETVHKVASKAMETSMKMNGVEEGIQQYSEVVNLLLEYYQGVLY